MDNHGQSWSIAGFSLPCKCTEMEPVVFFPVPMDELKKIIAESVNTCFKNQTAAASPPSDKILTAGQASKFLSLSRDRVYRLTQKKAIPHMKRGTRTFFSEQELIAWLKEGRQKTIKELHSEADSSIQRRPLRMK